MSKKDMRREDLIVPYMEPANQKNDADVQGTMASTLPMAAIFTRNKMIGWASVIFATQSWLSETAESKKSSSTPGYFSVGMALLSVAVPTFKQSTCHREDEKTADRWRAEPGTVVGNYERFRIIPIYILPQINKMTQTRAAKRKEEETKEGATEASDKEPAKKKPAKEGAAELIETSSLQRDIPTE
ncbi:Eukaryotic translation initiation factor eIF-1 [Taxawa tesnikishii (nom. ined.)]|nr:Eukaryotic translation initiation factor eIF-1 [Dothideales sp. JES 119]